VSVAGRAGAAFLAAFTLSPGAGASPEGRTGARASVCGLGNDSRIWQRTRPCFALTGDLLFGRARNGDFALGPFVELSTAGFWDARLGGGISALVPVHDAFPLVTSVGVFSHELRTAALGGTLFFGPRSYNFHGPYGLAAGLFASVSVDLGDRHETLVALGVDVDAVILAMPFLLLYNAVR
jgi:hypothetical protein